MKQKFLLLLACGLLITGVFIACKKKTSDTGSATASITALNCSGATFSATATANAVYAATATVPYTGGNGASYSAGSAISSTGVTGLTATLSSGTLASGAGNLSYTVSGTPTASGTASFALSFGGQSCTLTLTVNAAGGSAATVTALNCSSATASSAATINVAYTGTLTVPYTGGNGIAYSTGTAITSTGVAGLTATLAAGTLANGAGNIVYNVSGTPASSGTASFAITFGGQSCTMALTVNAASSGCASQSGVAKIVCLANEFLATLTSTQQASVVLTLNLTNAKRWSNLPCGLSCRNGLLLSSLTTTQQTAALALIQAASGTATGEGYNEFSQIRAADDYLNANGGGSSYGSGNYVIAFLGTPSTTGKWMLQFGGHHYAQNITYNAGQVISITPMHEAVEPKGAFTYNGTTYTGPIESEHTAMQDMLGSFTSTELTSAKISTTFSDCLMVPGSTTNTFPSTKQGIKVSNLSTAAQAKVLAAIAAWVNDVDPATAATYLNTYQNELANTYVCYASNTSGTAGNASSFLTANTDYVRIDGPGVWIEFVCQNGVVLSGVHYHTVMRDQARDYIGL